MCLCWAVTLGRQRAEHNGGGGGGGEDGELQVHPQRREKKVELGFCSSQLPLATRELGHTQLIGAGLRGSVWPHKGGLRPGARGRRAQKWSQNKGWMLAIDLLAKSLCKVSVSPPA